MTQLHSNQQKDNEAQLLTSNMGLVISIVKRFKPHINDYEDMIQHGLIGLLNAIRKHDESRGKLSTLATLSITRAILRYKQQQGKLKYRTLSSDLNLYTSADTTNINDYIPSSLSHTEKQIFLLRLQGYSFSNIGKQLNLNRLKVSKIFYRIVSNINV